MSSYRGPAEPFPFARHRSIGQIIEQNRRGAQAGMLAKYGDPAQRVEKAAELRARKIALGWSNETVAEVAGIWSSQVAKILSGNLRGSWPILNLIDAALARGERKAAMRGAA